MDKIKRQKIVEREQFTYDDKLEIAKKSNGLCCNCGRPVHFGYGATVEHFIPLSKGGTNRGINIVMLCKACNEEKNNFIYRPQDYLKYLNDEHYEKIKGYFDSYINSFDFINRDNLLACDRYKVLVSPMSRNLYKPNGSKKYKNLMREHATELWVKRATMDDVDKLTEYFIKYLKKYDCLDSESSARVNIEFWINFGCIYYIEKNNEIKTFITVTVTKANDHVYIKNESIDSYLTINIFTYYSNDYALTLAWNLSRQIPKYLVDEQNLSQLPVRYCVLKNDHLSYPLCEGGNINIDQRFINSFMVLYEPDVELPKITEDKALNEFFSRFGKVNKYKMDKWFENHDSDTLDWMIRELELEELTDKEREEQDRQLQEELENNKNVTD